LLYGHIGENSISTLWAIVKDLLALRRDKDLITERAEKGWQLK